MRTPIVPVYLNQSLVFDLMAMLSGGLTTVTSVETTQTENKTVSTSGRAGFGLAEALSSLVKVDFSADAARSKRTENDTKVKEERVHTPASLLFQLIETLSTDGISYIEAKDELPSPGEIVEFEGILERNALVEAMDTVVGFVDILKNFEEEPGPEAARKKSHAKPTKKTDAEKLHEQMRILAESVREGDTIDLITTVASTDVSAVISIDKRFLSDPLMSNLVDGSLRVLGKVIRTIPNQDGAISLLRKSSLRALPAVKDVFSQLVRDLGREGFELPKLETEVKGPAIHVIPIAIYA